jgi:hypothetical protein
VLERVVDEVPHGAAQRERIDARLAARLPPRTQLPARSFDALGELVASSRANVARSTGTRATSPAALGARNRVMFSTSLRKRCAPRQIEP